MSTWKNPLPGVPLIESPFFDEWLANSDLDEDTRRIATDLHRDGYAVFDLPADDFEEVFGQAFRLGLRGISAQALVHPRAAVGEPDL